MSVEVSDLPLGIKPVSATHRAFGGMDLGGTKLEAALFDEKLQEITRHRWPTSGADYPSLIAKLAEAAAWLDQTAAERGLAPPPALGKLPIGIGVPGVFDANTGLAATTNLPAAGKPLRRDVIEKFGRPVAMGNDSGLFAVSEANGGAGTGFATVFGLILGTGVGGGLCLHGRLHAGLNGVASLMTSEIGHIKLGHPKLTAHAARLTQFACGCGGAGCIETLVSGPGLARLGEYFTGQKFRAEEIAKHANPVAGSGATEAASPYDAGLAQAFDLWLDLAAELLKIIQLATDPEVIILGGGLSNIANLPSLLQERLAAIAFKTLKLPVLRVGKFGATSGVRGAAWLAYHQANPTRLATEPQI